MSRQPHFDPENAAADADISEVATAAQLAVGRAATASEALATMAMAHTTLTDLPGIDAEAAEEISFATDAFVALTGVLLTALENISQVTAMDASPPARALHIAGILSAARQVAGEVLGVAEIEALPDIEPDDSQADNEAGQKP